MSVVVAFDGSELSRAALRRACSIQRSVGEEIVVVTAIPKGNTNYARDRGWIGADADFDLKTVKSHLKTEVREICSNAEFRPVAIGRRPSKGGTANKIRKEAKAADASMIVVGSDNAGRITTALSSVGGGIATDTAYDVLIVRT